MTKKKLTVDKKASDSSAVRLDPSLTLALAHASLAAYDDFENNPFTAPANYRFAGRFTGWNDWLGPFGVEEKFGLIFKYIGPQMIANRFIIAFRGTDSLSDAFSDAFWDLTSFQAYKNSILPTPQVSAGFYGIYSGIGGAMTQSMQQQIFAQLPPNPSEVIITGHSLGGALSQLFTLDFNISVPNARNKTINFASPRVGDATFENACNLSGATSKITRIVNTWDIVPHYPTEFLDYVSVGAQFEVAFDRCNWVDFNVLSNHSMLNHQTVLNNCVYNTPQYWVGQFQDAVNSKYWMCSTKPSASAAVNSQWIDKLKEFADLKQSLGRTDKDSDQ